MRKSYLTIVFIFFVSGVYAQSNIHQSGGDVGIGTTSPVERVTIANEVPNALGIYRDLDVGAVGSAGVFFNFGARNGSQFTSGAQIAGVLDNPASTGWMTFSTLNSGSLSEKMRITKEGNVGIGVNNPSSKLDVSGNIKWDGANSGNPRALQIGYSGGNYGGIGYNIDYTGSTSIFNRPLADYTSYLEFTYGGFKFFGTDDFGSASNINLNGGGKNLNLRAVITREGNMGIGIANPSEKLAVNGNIRAREIKVETANWPDYVFTKDYAFPSLAEIEKHIKEKGHLPGIPSAEEVKANGIYLGEMNGKLLQKIEELTLYLIQIKKENEEQKLNNSAQQKQIEQQKKDIIYLKSRLK